MKRGSAEIYVLSLGDSGWTHSTVPSQNDDFFTRTP
jgi:hypothetical protein